MAGIIYDLIDVLTQQKECYEGLLTLSAYKSEAISKKELELLTEVVTCEENFIGRVNLLDKKREQLLKDIAVVTGIPYKEITVSKIIAKMGKDLPVSKDLEQIKTELVKLMNQLKKQNEINKNLLTHSLELIDFSITAIQSATTARPETNYAKSGETVGGELRHFFDYKQ